MKGNRAARRAVRRAQRVADLSGTLHVVRMDRLNKQYRIASRDAFRDADIRRVIQPGGKGDPFPIVQVTGVIRMENGRPTWRNK